MHMRRLSLLLAIIVLLTALPQWAVPVQAAYENTYSNTGNQRADIIGVALTQVGYREGSNNYTKYGVWFGRPNDPWCGFFVSWCASQAGIPTSVLRKTGLASPNSFGIPYYDGASYRPQPGDLFFTKSFGHVGIVYYTSGDYFYTLEGNTYEAVGGDGVFSRHRKISDYYFGVPNYRGDGSHSYATGYDSAHPHKEYKYCNHCADKYYTGNTGTSDSCTTCIQSACDHSYSGWSKVDSGKHTRTCSKCEKTVIENHSWKDGSVTKSPTCIQTGSQEQSCPDCGAEQTVTLPATGDHDFGDAAYVDDSIHRQICEICHQAENSDHSPNDGWLNDDQSHWRTCRDCGERFGLAEHSFPEGCLSPCEDCGYQLEGGHVLNEAYTSDATGHWNTCKNCTQVIDFSEHTYTSECDQFCDVCDYFREATTTHDEVWKGDESGHWQECKVCGTAKKVSPHTPDPKAKDWEALYCTLCKYELRSADEHVHSYHTIESDSKSHWGECICGEKLGPEVHSWSMQTKKCSVCDAANSAGTNASDNDWIILAVGGGVSVALLVTLIVLLAVSTKKKKAEIEL